VLATGPKEFNLGSPTVICTTTDADRVLIAHTGVGNHSEELLTAVYVRYLRQSRGGLVAVGNEESKWSQAMRPDESAHTQRVCRQG